MQDGNLRIHVLFTGAPYGLQVLGPLSGQFCTFNRQPADNKIISLANTVVRFNLHGFCAIVPQGLIKNKPRNKNGSVLGFMTGDSLG